jgi:hypothetical protein
MSLQYSYDYQFCKETLENNTEKEKTSQVHRYMPVISATWKLGEERFKASMDSISRPCEKRRKGRREGGREEENHPINTS